MYKLKKNIIVVCEGNSERAYIQELNRYLENNGIPLHFLAKPSNSGQYTQVIRKYKEIRKNNDKIEILIWVDWDRYQRNDNDDMKNYEKKPEGIPDFLFSYKNFEDFLSMHFNREKMLQWLNSCIKRKHFETPSHSREYIPEFQIFIGGTYEKGDMPIELNNYTLENLRAHQNDTTIPFKCDFAKKLLLLIDIM